MERDDRENPDMEKGAKPAGDTRSRPQSERERRLAEALRANLKRRKSQDRARRTGPGDAADGQGSGN